jgi:hypothetical protein
MILRELFKKSAIVLEGGNLASHNAAGEPTVGYTGVPGTYSAGKIDSKNRAAMQPAVKQLLVDINNLFTRQYGRPIWSPELVEKEVETFISGSSKWFMQLRQPNPNFNPQQPPSDVNPKEIGVTDKDFQRVKKKVGDIDTQIDRRLEPQIEEFLHKNIGANIGSATLLGTKKGSDQWLALWQLNEPPITLQVDLEFSDYTTDARGFEIPTEWAQVSHGSAWEDLELGMKGVFRQWLYRSLAKVAPTEKYIAKIAGAGKNKGMKLFGGDDGKELVADIDNPPPPLHDANFSFAVASVGGGGVRAKYRQPTAEENVPLEINGIPVMVPLTTAESEYIKDMGSQFEQFFGVPAKANETKMMASLVGTVELMKQFFTPEQQQVAVQEFLKINFGKGAQMIDADDPTSDFKTKMTAIDYVLDQTGMQNLRKQAVQMAKDYETAFNAKKQPQPLAEAEVKAQLRKGMPHLHDLKPADLLDLLDEIHDGNGNFKLQNIPLNVKIDGFGGRFGKNAEGKPFMGTSRTEPRYQAGFVAYHKQKGTTDPEVLGRAQLFDQLFNEMMNAVQLVDGKLGPDFLVNKQVTCEVLYLPFATETPEGKLKFVGIHYDKLPEGVHLALVPFRVVDATTGEDLPDSNKFIKELLKVGSSGRVMFIDNSLTQDEALDVTALVPPLENIEQLKGMLASNKLEARRQVKAALEPVAAALESAIINDPNIIGKDMLGQDYEGIVINSRLGPIKVTSQEQRDVITAKNAAKATARTERPRGEAKTAVVAIGSFIGHKGHEELFNYTINKAKEVGGDPYLFIGNAEGKDDPIPPAVKVQTWHKLYPQYAQNISTVQAGGALIQKVKHELINPLPGKPPRYDNIVIMVGEDRAGMNMPNALMKAVNKFQGYEHVKVSLEVTPRGTGISGTALRNSLKSEAPEKALATWSNAFDVQKLGAEWIKHLMDITRKGMGIQEPQQPVQQQQPVPVAEHRLLNALIRPEKTENRLDEFDLFKKSAPMKTPASKPGASSAEMRKFFQSQANKDKPGLKPKSVDMDNPQKVYTRHAQEEIEDNDAMSRMARDLTGPGAPDAKRRAQRDQQRQQDRAQSDGRDHGPKWDVEEGEQDPQSELKLINQKLKDAYKQVRNNSSNSSASIGWYMSQVKALNSRREELIKQLRQGVAEDSQEINWVKPNFDFEWHEVEEQSRMKQVPVDVRQYYQKHFPNKDAWLKAVQNGKAVAVPPDHAYEIRNAPFDKASLQKVLAPTGHEGPIGPAKEKRVNDLFDKGQVEMPIILKTSQGLWLIGGKTRLGTANYVKGLPAKVWLISGEQGVTEGPQDDPEDYRAHLLKTLPRMMNFLSKNVKGWKPTEEQYLAAIETGYQVMKHTGDVQQAGKAMSDELNTLHRMSQSKSGMMEAGSPAQQAAIAISMKKAGKKPKGVSEAPKSAAVRLGNAIKRVQGTTAASQARSVIPSSIPKPEPKPQEKQVTKELKTGPAAHFTPKDAHVKRGQFVGGESKKKGADGKACWDGYRYNGTKNGKDSCVKVSEDIENIMSTLINKIVVNEAIQNNNR